MKKGCKPNYWLFHVAEYGIVLAWLFSSSPADKEIKWLQTIAVFIIAIYFHLKGESFAEKE